MYGKTTIEELEKAGAFENLKVIPEKERFEPAERKPFWQEYSTVLASLFFIILGYLSHYTNGEDSVLTIAAFVAGMLVGGYSLFKTGLKNLMVFEFDMKTLMTIAIIGAAIIGEWSEGAVVVVLFAISEALETY